MILLPQSLNARIAGISHHYVYDMVSLQTGPGVWGQSPVLFPSDSADILMQAHVRTTAPDSLREGVSGPKEK